ncbi:regulator of ribosome biosynthesis (RRS1) [Vairimorpha necatrix]|uniref:Ribosome biogenesis regulatory protein n=1 Tax=Vairimorpha necatrix TaxID=6039 RepID=A0AAX4JFC6_9MICR
MKALLNFLTVKNDIEFPEKENFHIEINKEASKMIFYMKCKIKEHKSVQKDLDLVYVLDSADYKLPLQYSENNTKTKWEAFALKKGIKKKKGTLVYDEELKKYVPRFGPYSKKNLVMKSAIIEGEKSYNDLKREKKERIKRNEMNKAANKKRK